MESISYCCGQIFEVESNEVSEVSNEAYYNACFGRNLHQTEMEINKKVVTFKCYDNIGSSAVHLVAELAFGIFASAATLLF